MDTITTKVLKLINECDNETISSDVKQYLQDLKCKVEQLKGYELELINRTYMVGYTDKESNRSMQNNYYKQQYEPFVFTINHNLETK
jgi:hypothetical protein